MNSLAERIDKKRKELGISERELARRADIAESLLGNHRRDAERSMRADVVLKLATVLGVSVSWLLTGNDDEDAAGLPDPYPNRRKALAAARALGTFAPEDLETLRKIPGFYEGDRDEPDPDWWMRRLENIRAERLGLKQDRIERLRIGGNALAPSPPPYAAKLAQERKP